MPIPEVIFNETVTQQAATILNSPYAAVRAAAAARGEQRVDAMLDLNGALRRLSPLLPELPDPHVDEIYERVVAAESAVVGPNRAAADYGEGKATEDDGLLVIGRGAGALIMEAQHATDPVRKDTGKREGADHGTGGLSLVVAEDTDATVMVATGRQTGNANVTPDHPMKQRLAQLYTPGARFLSVHGMAPGKVISPLDSTEIHAIIGLGLQPNEADFDAAERLRYRAGLYGLRLVTGNVVPHLSPAKDPRWNGTDFRDFGTDFARNSSGELTATRVAGMMQQSTVTQARRHHVMPARQLEISRTLRLPPVDMYKRDPSAVKHGVYFGYIVTYLAAETW